MICSSYIEPLYFFYVPDLPTIIYYSYIPSIIVALIVGVVVLLSNRKSLLNQLLFGICISFVVWTFSTLVDWTNIHSNVLLFAWSLLGPSAGFISIFSVYFTYVFVQKKDVGLRTKALFVTLLAPLIILAPTSYTLHGFNLTSCDAFGFEGLTNTFYFPFLGALSMVWILVVLITYYRKSAGDIKKQILLMGTGIEFFLLSFFVTEFLGQHLTTIGILPDSQIETYGYFGMIVFMIYISIIIIRFKAFNVNLIASQALITALLILIASQFAFIRNPTNIALNVISFLITGTIGFILIRSMKREIEQRETIESLAKNLEKSNAKMEETNKELETLNVRLKELDKAKDEFLSIATHQLKAPLSSIRGAAANILDGSFGKLSSKIKQPVESVFEVATSMVRLIDDYLNISRIEQGRMKYELSDFDITLITKKVADDLRVTAVKKNIELIFNGPEPLVITADVGKMTQVVTNLVDNAIKYTPKGHVTATAEKFEKDGKEFARVTVSDSGIGIDPSEIGKLFQRFSRATDANKTNTQGTGLGLYVAKQLTEGCGGVIRIESDGLGKGSRFIIEFPITQKK